MGRLLERVRYIVYSTLLIFTIFDCKAVILFFCHFHRKPSCLQCKKSVNWIYSFVFIVIQKSVFKNQDMTQSLSVLKRPKFMICPFEIFKTCMTHSIIILRYLKHVWAHCNCEKCEQVQKSTIFRARKIFKNFKNFPLHKVCLYTHI